MKSQIRNQAVTHQHERHNTDTNPQPIQPDRFNGREIRHPTKLPIPTLVNVVVLILHTQEQLVAVVAVAEVLHPEDEGGDLLDVVAAGDEEDEGGDGGEGGGLLDVHEDGAEGQAEALGDEDAVEDDEEGEEEGGWVGVEASHEVDYEYEGCGEGQL